MDSTVVNIFELRNYIDTIEPPQEDASITIFPNPFTDNVRIHPGSKSKTISLRITDIFGRLVYDFENAIKMNYVDDYLWDGRNYQNSIVSPGMYLLFIETSNGKQIRNIIFSGK
jgi:flagellar hook assembly protein FlgD